MRASELAFMRYVEAQQARGFDVAFSGRRYRKRTGEALVGRGLLSTANAVVSDGDGFTGDAERWRVGYELTPGGREALAAKAAVS